MKRSLPTAFYRHRRFTLVEMLVVIAIIAILASLLAPGLQRALATARQTFCADQLKQLHLAFTMYADSNGDYYPPLWTSAGGAWPRAISPFVGPAVTVDYLTITKCPEWQSVNGATPKLNYQIHDFFSTTKGGLLWSQSKQDYRQPWRGSLWAQKSRGTLPMLNEGAPKGAGVDMSNCYTYGPDDLVQARHGQGTNLVFYDGHATFEANWAQALTLQTYHYYSVP